MKFLGRRTLRASFKKADLNIARLKIYNYDVYPEGVTMRVAKWGNSLAVRLPAAIVEALELKIGDDIEITVAGSQKFAVKKDRSREQAIAALRKLRRPLPAGFVFDREDANAR